METVTFTSMQRNIDESKKFHSFIGESLENSDLKSLSSSENDVYLSFTYFTQHDCQ